MIKVNRTLELHLKTPTMHRVCLLAVLLLTLPPTVQAASITVRNQGGYVASFAVKGCDRVNNVGDISYGQERTVILDTFTYLNTNRTCPDTTLEIYVHTGLYWYTLAYDNRYPTGFRRVKESVWIVEGGLPSEANRPLLHDLLLVLQGTTGWATVGEYKVSRDLSRATLYYTDLSKTNFSEANLNSAFLSGADLSNADLSDANLSYADLRKANLTDADLKGANLRLANLYEAILTYAKTDNTTKCPDGRMGPCW